MSELPLTVLFHEGPIARAYLEVIRRMGHRPSRILRMVPRAGALVRFLPRGFRTTMAAQAAEQRANYWPRKLAAAHPALVGHMEKQIDEALGLGEGFAASLRANAGLETYSDRIEPVEVTGLKDAALIEALRGVSGNVLFTGGGIVPKAVFDVPGLSLLHVHPGYLPPVRGADGLLWSSLTRGRPGASAFVMVPGLDAGDLLHTAELPALRFPVASDLPADQDLYRLLFSLYDPAIRAHVLRPVIERIADGAALTGTPQDETEGRTYHFMNSRIRHLALGTIYDRH